MKNLTRVILSPEYTNESEKIPAGVLLTLVRTSPALEKTDVSKINPPVLDYFKCQLCSSSNEKVLMTTCCSKLICKKCCEEKFPSYSVCPFCKKAGDAKENDFLEKHRQELFKFLNNKGTAIIQTAADEDIGPSDPLYNFLVDAKFFIIKSVNKENIDISQSKNIWATTIHNQTKLSEAFRGNKNVILIFSMNKSASYQGIAKMSTDIGERDPSPFNPPMCAKLGGGFGLYWIIKGELPFSRLGNINNPLNGNEPIKKSRDTQVS